MDITATASEKQDVSSFAAQGSKRRVSRISPLAIFWFIGWPLLTVLLGALYTVNAPTTKDVPFFMALGGTAVGIVYLMPEFLVTAAILFAVSWAVFRLFPADDGNSKRRHWLEPVLAFFGLSLGISLEFPAILNNSIFTPIRSLPLVAGWAALFMFLLIAAMLRNGWKSRKLVRVVGPVAAFVALGWGLTELPVAGRAEGVNKGSTVILGVDSMGLMSDIGHLYNFTQQNGGAWYDRAVTPGLLTNAVWTAILEHRPIHETGTTMIFETPDWNRSPFQLVREAKRQGYQTWSYFTGQNTIYVGSIGGFDVDRSGPMGWVDNATVGAKNGSVFTSFLVSRLPRIPFSQIRRNQAGTYAYDLSNVVHNILTDHDGPRPVFAVAHLGYLHDDAYPRFAQLSAAERRVLLTARIDSLTDLGSDWQNLPIKGDRLDLRSWKYRYVQQVITDEISKTGFVNPQNHNRLVILSDHGVRTGLTVENFNKEYYYRVPLITFGLPVRDLEKPISLLDVAGLVGIEDPTSPNPADPVVEYVNFATNQDFAVEIRAAKWTADGRISFTPDTQVRALALLRRYAPYGAADHVGSQSLPTQAPDHQEISHSARPKPVS